MTEKDQIVAVGLLSARDLERLGSGFDRAYAIADDNMFEHLITLLDRIAWPGGAVGDDSTRLA
ncbi:hypothetical protein P1X14_00210 [Sphingomonas sp. AOB5]|uniref:hypothetical protein n=1 Tax=Sphingomonas sp. AOB5 TaxID=3034017 RepID=UPI0023F61E1B|nr:hypothetical protein [Sphingomonas sp. AOB5]MDF7773654.1 hypothetical protein [Sphingomonas sp. AOB5]